MEVTNIKSLYTGYCDYKRFETTDVEDEDRHMVLLHRFHVEDCINKNLKAIS